MGDVSNWAARPVALLLVLLCTSCVAPAVTESQYEAKAASTAADAHSVIETVRLAIDSASRHRLPSNPIDVVLSDQESVLGSVSATFSSIQPPTEDMDRLREEVLDLLDEAESKIAEVRIAFRRGDIEDASATAESLADVSTQLDGIATQLG